MKLGLSDFQKVHEDEHSAILKHPKGHHVVIAKKSLSSKLLDQLGALHMNMAEGGEVPLETSSPPPEEETPTPSALPPEIDYSTAVLPELAVEPAASKLGGVGYDISAYQAQVPTTPPPQVVPQQGAPPPQAYLPPPPMGGAGTISNQAARDIRASTAEMQQGADLQAQATADQAAKVSKAKDDFDRLRGATRADADAALTAWKEGSIDRDRLWKNKDTSAKAMNIIGLVLGAMGAAKTGGENLGLKALNKQIEDDVNDQRAAIEQKKSVYSAYLDRYKDPEAAYNAAIATQNLIYASKIDGAAAKMKSADAKKNAAIAIEKLQGDAYDRMEKAALSRAMLQAKAAHPTETQEQRSLTVETPEGVKYRAYSPADASKVRASIAGHRDLMKSLNDFEAAMSADINPFSAQSAAHAAQVADLQAKLKDPERYNFGQLSGGDLTMMNNMLSSGGSWNRKKVLTQIALLRTSQTNKMQGMLKSQLEGYQPPASVNTKRVANVPAGYNANSRK